MLQGLDAVLRPCYHQSLDEIMNDFYVHNVISTADPGVDEILRTLQSTGILQGITGPIIDKYVSHKEP